MLPGVFLPERTNAFNASKQITTKALWWVLPFFACRLTSRTALLFTLGGRLSTAGAEGRIRQKVWHRVWAAVVLAQSTGTVAGAHGVAPRRRRRRWWCSPSETLPKPTCGKAWVSVPGEAILCGVMAASAMRLRRNMAVLMWPQWCGQGALLWWFSKEHKAWVRQTACQNAVSRGKEGITEEALRTNAIVHASYTHHTTPHSDERTSSYTDHTRKYPHDNPVRRASIILQYAYTSHNPTRIYTSYNSIRRIHKREVNDPREAGPVLL